MGTGADKAGNPWHVGPMSNIEAASDSGANIHEFTVTELSQAVKRTVEQGFSYVRVRGELGRVSRPASGHVYLDLKDDKAVLNGVIWRGVASRLKIAPEQGLEVVCTGKLTTYPGQSRYQIVIEQMEPAGVGALMALLEERRKKLAAEGLFDDVHKKPLPFLPEVIGVVTSPTGAVIRDILHRLDDRFPRHVLIWPVLVQGEQAAAQIAEAIKGFNRLKDGGPVPRPDVLIVARGGGSIEDLWSFNEEAVVRAAFDSTIPLISAVGHETDTTLIDFAADRRAPTPTAAAEMAVPVRTELTGQVKDLDARLLRAEARLLDDRQKHVASLSRGLPRLDDILALPSQRLDNAGERLNGSLRLYIEKRGSDLTRLGQVSARPLLDRIQFGTERLEALGARLARALDGQVARAGDRLVNLEKLLRSYSHQGVLDRGFALVMSDKDKLVRRADELTAGDQVSLRFADGHHSAVIGDDPAPAQKRPKKAKKPDQKDREEQGSLFET